MRMRLRSAFIRVFMHILTAITIRNFRSCEAVTLDLAPYTPFVGYNNAGKSNILSAIRWLVAPFALTPADYLQADHPIQVDGTITGITPALLDRLEARHRSKVQPFVSGETIQIRREQREPGSPKTSTLHVFDPSQPADPWRVNPAGIPEALKALFPEPIVIGAMEDAVEDAAKAKTTTTIGKLLAEFTGAIEDAHAHEVSQVLQQLRASFSANGAQRSAALQRFDEAASSLVHDFFPGVRLHLEIPVPDMSAMLKGGTIKVSEREGAVRDFDSLGHGAQRSIQMALVRYLADIRRTDATKEAPPAQRLLIIDEPELYLHPQAVEQLRSALTALSSNGYQVLFSTHSPMMIGRQAICDTRLVRKNEHGITHIAPSVQHTLQQFSDDPKSQLSTLLELKNAGEWLFADRVLLVEGKTERRILPRWIEHATGQSLAARKMALVELQGAGALPKCMAVLKALGIPSFAIADLDFALTHAAHLPEPEALAPLLLEAKQQLTALAQTDPLVLLGGNGLPRKPQSGEQGYKASETVKRWAATPAGKATARQLAEKLRDRGVWLWPAGDIECHFGLGDKDEVAWHQFVAQLTEMDDWRDCVPDEETARAFIGWLESICAHRTEPDPLHTASLT